MREPDTIKSKADKKPAPSAKTKAKSDQEDDPWGAWPDYEIEPTKVDYERLDLNKLSDKEL